MKIASVCMNVTYNKNQNLETYLKYIDEVAEQGSNLVVFPEQSLQGYLGDLNAVDVSNSDTNEFDYQYKNAEIVPDGPSTQRLIEKAREKNLYIVFGMTEKDQETDFKLYNTAVLIGPEGFVGKYRKVHQPGDELHIYYGGKTFPVFDTEIGKIGLLICYDKWFPETCRELALGGADICIMPTATCYESEAHDIKTDYTYYTFELMDKVRALENQTFFIASNQYGQCGKSFYFGNSKIVAPTGKVVAETGQSEGIAYYETEDLHKEIYDAKHRWGGLSFLKDRHPSYYTRISEDHTYTNFN